MAWKLLPTDYTDAVWSGLKLLIQVRAVFQHRHDVVQSFVHTVSVFCTEEGFLLIGVSRNIVERYRTIGVIDLCVSFQTTPNSVRIISRK